MCSDTDGIGNKPAEHKRRKIKRGYAAENTQGLPNDFAINAGRNHLKRFSLDQCRYPAGRFDNLNYSADLSTGFTDMFGLIQGDGHRQFFFIIIHGFAHIEQISHALGYR